MRESNWGNAQRGMVGGEKIEAMGGLRPALCYRVAMPTVGRHAKCWLVKSCQDPSPWRSVVLSRSKLRLKEGGSLLPPVDHQPDPLVRLLMEMS